MMHKNGKELKLLSVLLNRQVESQSIMISSEEVKGWDPLLSNKISNLTEDRILTRWMACSFSREYVFVGYYHCCC